MTGASSVTQSTTSSFGKIGSENIKALIFGFLGPEDLATASRVSKGWKSLMEKESVWQPSLHKEFPRHYKHILDASRQPGQITQYIKKVFALARQIANHPVLSSLTLAYDATVFPQTDADRDEMTKMVRSLFNHRNQSLESQILFVEKNLQEYRAQLEDVLNSFNEDIPALLINPEDWLQILAMLRRITPDELKKSLKNKPEEAKLVNFFITRWIALNTELGKKAEEFAAHKFGDSPDTFSLSCLEKTLQYQDVLSLAFELQVIVTFTFLLEQANGGGLSVKGTLQALEEQQQTELKKNIDFLLKGNHLADSGDEPLGQNTQDYKEIRAIEAHNSKLIKKIIKEYETALNAIDFIPGITEPKTLVDSKTPTNTQSFSPNKATFFAMTAAPTEAAPLTKKLKDPDPLKDLPKKPEAEEKRQTFFQKLISCLMNFFRSIFPCFSPKKT